MSSRKHCDVCQSDVPKQSKMITVVVGDMSDIFSGGGIFRLRGDYCSTYCLSTKIIEVEKK